MARKATPRSPRNYLLANGDLERIACENPFFTVKLGPFLDTGGLYDPSSSFGSREWLSDTGLQTKFRVFGSDEIIFGYSKDSRSGRNSLFGIFSR